MRGRRQIAVELTALLDVILIMLFVILMQARGQTAQALAASEAEQSRVAALESENEALRQSLATTAEESESWRRRVLTQDLVLDNSLVVTISVEEDRSIRLVSESDEEVRILYSWENDTYARNALSAKIQEILQEDTAAVFLVLQYDRDSIYWTEHRMIQEIFQEAKLQAQDRGLPLSILELDISTDQNGGG